MELWFQDEARLGLHPIIRRQWCVRGSRPEEPHKIQYKWLYVYGFVNPSSGENFWLILSTVNIELMNLALKEFKEYIDPESNREIILVLDGAGWHRSDKLSVPEGITIQKLPAYTPELQPVERAWPLFREVLANEEIKDMDELTQRMIDRSIYLNERPEIIGSHCGYKWIKQISNTTN